MSDIKVIFSSVVFVFSVVTVFVSLNAGASSQIYNADIEYGDELLFDKKFDEAEEIYLSVLEVSQPTGEKNYYKNEIYRTASLAHSRASFVQLTRENIEAAGDDYRDAIENLREAYETHADQSAAKNTAQKFISKEIGGFLKGQLGQLGGRLGKNTVTREIDKRFNIFGKLSSTVQDLVKIPPPPVELGAQRVSEKVVHHEVRIPVIPDTSYFQLIGRVRTDQGHCTGSLVGPNLVLTNAHCIFKKQGSSYKRVKGKYRFRREWLYYEEEYEAATYYTFEGRRGGWDGQNKNDWAILVLDDKSGGDALLPGTYLATLSDLSDLGTFEANKSVFLAGYAGDLNRGLYMTMHWGCEMEPESLALPSLPDSFHNCQRYGGLSGAPIIHLDSADRPYVVSIHSGRNPGRKSPYKSRAVPPTNWYPTLRELLDS